MKKFKVIMMLVMLLLYGISMFSISYLYNKKEKDTNIKVKKENISTKDKDLYSSANYNTIRSLIYPVGSIYITTTDDTVAKVQARYGGTWEEYADSRVLVGVDEDNLDYYVGASAGSKEHRHEHYNLKAAIGAFNGDTSAIGYIGTGPEDPTGGAAGVTTYGIVRGSFTQNKNFNHFTPVVGYTSTNSNVPPYVVVYIYRRTA